MITEEEKKEIIDTLIQLEGVKTKLHAILRRHNGKELDKVGGNIAGKFHKEGEGRRAYSAFLCVQSVERK